MVSGKEFGPQIDLQAMSGQDMVVSIVPDRRLNRQPVTPKSIDVSIPVFQSDIFIPHENNDFQQSLYDYPIQPLSPDELEQRINRYSDDPAISR